MGAFSSLTPTPVPMQCSGSFACFGGHPSLANRTDATVEVVVARSQNYPNCSSKLCRWLGPCETRSLLQRRLSKNCKFGTAYQAPWSERDLNRDYAVQNSEAACCIGRDHSPLFPILDLTSQGYLHFSRFRHQPPCSGSFVCLWSHPSFASRSDATADVGVARLEHCSSLWYSLGPCETRSLEKRKQCDNHKFGTVTSDQEIVQCKAVKRPGSAFSILDLTCHGHLHLYRVRHQPPCSFSFAFLGHPSHANCADATVEVVVARFQNYPKVFFQSVPYIGPIWDQISTAKEALQELQVWDSYQGPWSKMNKESAVQNSEAANL